MALAGATATCVEHPTAPDVAELVQAPPPTAAVTTSIVHKLLTSGNSR